MKHYSLPLLSIVLVLTSCANIKRYSIATDLDCLEKEEQSNAICEEQAKVRLAVFVADPGRSSARTLFDLDGEGEAAAINAIAGGEKLEASSLSALLAAPVREKAGAQNLTSFTRQVSFGVLPSGVSRDNIANRIDQIETRLTLVQPGTRNVNLEFKKIDKIENQYTKFEFGTTTLQTDLNAKIEPSFAGKLIGTGSVSSGIVGTVNQNVSRKVLILAPYITEDEVTILQTGDEGQPLGGQTTFDVTISISGIRPEGIDQHSILGIDSATEPKAKSITFQRHRKILPYGLR